MNNKTIIISTISFLLVSFVFLSWSEKKQADMNSKNIWVTYFLNPKDNSLNFVIENHSKNTDFKYQIFEDKDVIKQESVSVKLGESKNITVSSNLSQKKMTIEVETGNEKKEIYKTFQ